MTPSEHKQRHIELHRALDQLFADFIAHHPDRSHFFSTPLGEFLEWSHQQTIIPTEHAEHSGDGDSA